MDYLIANIEVLLKRMKSDKFSREYSWEHCYDAFVAIFQSDSVVISAEERDHLALSLFVYLASWGMLRNSFLLEKDYKALYPIVDVLISTKYANLRGIKIADYDERSYSKLEEIAFELCEAYRAIRKTANGFEARTGDVSDTLVTKTLLGALGCVPAYDTQITKSLKLYALPQKYGVKSIIRIVNFMKLHHKVLDHYKNLKTQGGNTYPDMKLIDMCFWAD